MWQGQCWRELHSCLGPKLHWQMLRHATATVCTAAVDQCGHIFQLWPCPGITGYLNAVMQKTTYWLANSSCTPPPLCQELCPGFNHWIHCLFQVAGESVMLFPRGCKEEQLKITSRSCQEHPIQPGGIPWPIQDYNGLAAAVRDAASVHRTALLTEPRQPGQPNSSTHQSSFIHRHL
jgi:hypothetical protein